MAEARASQADIMRVDNPGMSTILAMTAERAISFGCEQAALAKLREALKSEGSPA